VTGWHEFEFGNRLFSYARVRLRTMIKLFDGLIASTVRSFLTPGSLGIVDI